MTYPFVLTRVIRCVFNRAIKQNQKIKMTEQKYPSLPIRIVVSFLTNFIIMAIAAMTIGDTFVQPTYFPELASENPNMALLGGGALLMGMLIAILYPSFCIKADEKWFINAVKVAVPMGFLIFFATHMVQAGYIDVSPTGWLLEGLYDSIGPMVAIVVLAWLTKRKNQK